MTTPTDTWFEEMRAIVKRLRDNEDWPILGEAANVIGKALDMIEALQQEKVELAEHLDKTVSVAADAVTRAETAERELAGVKRKLQEMIEERDVLLGAREGEDG